MAITLDDPPQPDWPEGLEVTTYDPERDEAAVHAAQQESFRDHWEHIDRSIEEWRTFMVETPGFDPSLWFIARDDGEIAGISLCRVALVGRAGARVRRHARRPPARGASAASASRSCSTPSAR